MTHAQTCGTSSPLFDAIKPYLSKWPLRGLATRRLPPMKDGEQVECDSIVWDVRMGENEQ